MVNGQAGVTAGDAPYEGVAVTLADKRSYVIPAFSLGQVKRYRSELQRLKDLNFYNDDEAVDVVVTLAHSALQRNYSEMTIEQVADLITLANAQHVTAAIVGVNELREPPKGPVKGP